MYLSMGDERIAGFDVRIVRCDDGAIRVLEGTEAFASVEEAMVFVERGRPRPDDPAMKLEFEWREPGAPIGDGEYACPICGELAYGSERYPRRVCPACDLETTDARGRPVRFGGTSIEGGFRAFYADDRASYPDGECYIRGVRCQAEEHRFGGIAVQTVEPNDG